MSILARHRYIISRVAEAFGFSDENEIEKLMIKSEVIPIIDDFFTAEGPTKILITIEDFQEMKKIGHFNNQITTVQKLMIFTGDIEKPPKTSIYFSKNPRGRDNDLKVAIDPTKINDNALSFGVIRAPIETLEAIMRCVYRPMIDQMATSSWGEASSEQKTEFMGSVDGFIRGLQESIRSLSGGLELKKADPAFENLTASSANDPYVVSQCANLLQDWCTVSTYRFLILKKILCLRIDKFSFLYRISSGTSTIVIGPDGKTPTLVRTQS